MQLTAELRWFYRGTLPSEIFQWFQQDQSRALAPPEEREDLYLYSLCEYLVSNSGRGGWKSNGVRQN